MTEPMIVDVRDDLKKGLEPFHKIMAAVEALEPGQPMVLLATFEPVPLIKVLQGKGFDAEVEETGPDDWKVTFTPQQ